jgi:hypothetical protein
MERHVRCCYREVTATLCLELGHFLHQNPTNAVGGSFILSLDGRERAAPSNPANAVGEVTLRGPDCGTFDVEM